MRCDRCHEEVGCPEHGEADVKWTEATVLNGVTDPPFAFCEPCVRKYETALGAILHICAEDDILGLGGHPARMNDPQFQQQVIAAFEEASKP